MLQKTLKLVLAFLVNFASGDMIDGLKDLIRRTCGSAICPDISDFKDFVYTECCNWNDRLECCIWPQKWVVVLTCAILLFCCCCSCLSCCCRRR